MKKLSLALLVLLATACAHDSDNNNATPAPEKTAGNGGSKAASGPVVNTTDFSGCGNASVPSSIEGNWQFSTKQGDFNFLFTLEIRNGQVSAINQCSYHGESLSAEVTVPASYTDTQFSVLGNGQDDETSSNAGSNLDCSVSTKPMSVSYYFKGRCLVMDSNGQEIVFVPAP